jgi:hypothetical protein
VVREGDQHINPEQDDSIRACFSRLYEARDIEEIGLDYLTAERIQAADDSGTYLFGTSRKVIERNYIRRQPLTQAI